MNECKNYFTAIVRVPLERRTESIVWYCSFKNMKYEQFPFWKKMEKEKGGNTKRTFHIFYECHNDRQTN